MLLVVLKRTEQDTKISIPPFLLPILPVNQLSPCKELLNPIFHYFKQYLSPFISQKNLKLSINSNPIFQDYPLFMYLDYKEYLQQCVCTLGPSQQQKNKERKSMIRNCVVVAIYDPNQLQSFKTIKNDGFCKQRIFPKARLQGIDQLVSTNDQIVINNKKINLKHNYKLSDVIKQQWDRYESKNSSCLYVRITK